MKICYFKLTILEHGGGVENYYIQSTSHFSNKEGITCDIVTLNDSFTKKLEQALSFYYFKKKEITYAESYDNITSSTAPGKYIKCGDKKSLLKILNSYDVVYVKNELIEAAYIKYYLGYKNLPPIIFGVHTPLLYPTTESLQSKLHNALYGGFVYKHLTSGVKAFHTLNSHDENTLQTLHDNKTIKTIANPFDSKEFYAKKPTQDYDIASSQSKISIAWVGRLTEQKGIHSLLSLISYIDSIPTLKDKVEWNIVGTGELQNEVEKVANSLESVNYYGYVENQNISQFLKSQSIFISTSKWEGYPYNILEALSVGLKVFTMNIPGCRDILSYYNTGVICNTDDDMKQSLTQELSLHQPQDYDIKIDVQIDTPQDVYSSLFNFFKDQI